MIKIVALIKRRSDLTLEEFCTYYEQQHAPLFVRSIPAAVSDAIIHYVQNHAIRLGGSSTDPAYDCVTEIGFEDVAGMRRWTEWYLGDEGQVLRDDEENFMDPRQRIVIVTDERRPAGP
jgi:uncharacterized protein (TIGR02118 family)